MEDNNKTTNTLEKIKLESKEIPISLAQRIKLVINILEQGEVFEISPGVILAMSENYTIGIIGKREIDGKSEDVVLGFDYPLDFFIKDIRLLPDKVFYILAANSALQSIDSKKR